MSTDSPDFLPIFASYLSKPILVRAQALLYMGQVPKNKK